MDDFLARDMLYISSGFAFYLALGAISGLLSLDSLHKLGQINSLLLMIIVIPALFYCYATAFSIREVLCAMKITTSATIFDRSAAPKDALCLYLVLRGGKSFTVSDEIKKSLSLTSVIHRLEKNSPGYGSAKSIRRSIYLKEMCATTGALGLVSASIGFLGSLATSQWRVSLACFVLILVSTFLCRLAFYQSMRGAALASDWRNAYLKVNPIITK